jgi:hypothetical protein
MFGAPVVGEVWTVDIKVDLTIVKSFRHLVMADEGLGDIAQAFAAAINAEGWTTDVFTATVEGNKLIIVKLTPAGELALEMNIEAAGSASLAGDITFATIVPVAVVAELTGIPAEGETWRIALGSDTVEHEVVAGQTLGDIAQALAAGIVAAGMSDLTALAMGESLVIINLAGDPVAPTFTINGATDARLAASSTTPTAGLAGLAGLPVAGDVWTILFDSMAYQYQVGAGETLEDVAAGLAADMNTTAPAEFVAMALGSQVLILNLDGAVFTLTGTFTFGHVAVVADTLNAQSLAAVATLAGAPLAGEEWGVALLALNTSSTSTFVYTVLAGDTTPDIAEALARMINGAGGDFIARAEGRRKIML